MSPTSNKQLTVAKGGDWTPVCYCPVTRLLLSARPQPCGGSLSTPSSLTRHGGRCLAEPREAGPQEGPDSTSSTLRLFGTSPGFGAHSDVPGHPALPPTHPPPALEVGLPGPPCSEGTRSSRVVESRPTVPSRPLPGPSSLDTGQKASLPGTAPLGPQHPRQRPAGPDSSPFSGHALDTASTHEGALWPSPYTSP